MKTDVDAALRELADFYVKNRREITQSELAPILLKHCGSEAEVQKFTSFLDTEPGQLRFKTHLRERKGQKPGTPPPSITEIINETIKELGKSPKEINSGWCGQFAGKVITKIEAIGEKATYQDRPLIPKYAGHIWIKYKGRHYDAEHPEGVVDYRSLFNEEGVLEKTKMEPSQLKETEEEKLLVQIDYWQKYQNKVQNRDVEDFTIAIRDMGMIGMWARYFIPRYPAYKQIGSYNVTYEAPIGDIIEHLLVSRLASYLKEALPETECQIISPQYYDVLTWFGIPVPDYSFAIEPEVKERKIDMVLQRLKDGVGRIHDSSLYREFLITMAKFHNYSLGNQMLIMLQKPSATRVAGFVTWKDLGRYVRAGEKGIDILAPCLPPRILKCLLCEKTFTERELRTHIVEVHHRGDVSILVREAREEAVGVLAATHFKVVSVFDVSQTGGKPLPEIEVPVLTGEANETLFDNVANLAKGQGVSVSFEPRPNQNPEIKGSYLGKDIWVRPEESRAQQLKTLLHEVAHYFTEGVFRIPRQDAETIAESVAFTVAAHYGFDTGARSFAYVALWARDKKVLEQNLANIHKVSGRMIEELGQGG